MLDALDALLWKGACMLAQTCQSVCCFMLCVNNLLIVHQPASMTV